MFVPRRGSTSASYSDPWVEKEARAVTEAVQRSAKRRGSGIVSSQSSDVVSSQSSDVPDFHNVGRMTQQEIQNLYLHAAPARRSSQSSDQQADPVKVYENKLVRQFYREAEVTANEPDVNKPALVYIPREVDKISDILASDLGLTAEQRTHTGKFVVVRQAGDRITGQKCEAITNDQCTADKTGDRCSTKSAFFGLSKTCGMTDKYLAKLTWNLNYYAAVYSKTNPGDEERIIPSRFPVRAILLDTASAHELLTSIEVDTPVGRLSGPNLIDLIVMRFQLGVEKGGLSYSDMLSAIYCVTLCEDLDYSRQTERAVDYLMALALGSKRVPLHTRIQFLNEQLKEPEELKSNPKVARVPGGNVRFSSGLGGLTKLAVLGVLLSFAQGASGAGDIAAQKLQSGEQRAVGAVAVAGPLQTTVLAKGGFGGAVAQVHQHPYDILDAMGESDAIHRAIGQVSGQSVNRGSAMDNDVDRNVKVGITRLARIRDHREKSVKRAAAANCELGTPNCNLAIAKKIAAEAKLAYEKLNEQMPETTEGMRKFASIMKGSLAATTILEIMAEDPDAPVIGLLHALATNPETSPIVRREIVRKFLQNVPQGVTTEGILFLQDLLDSNKFEVEPELAKIFNSNIPAVNKFYEGVANRTAIVLDARDRDGSVKLKDDPNNMFNVGTRFLSSDDPFKVTLPTAAKRVTPQGLQEKTLGYHYRLLGDVVKGDVANEIFRGHVLAEMCRAYIKTTAISADKDFAELTKSAAVNVLDKLEIYDVATREERVSYVTGRETENKDILAAGNMFYVMKFLGDSFNKAVYGAAAVYAAPAVGASASFFAEQWKWLATGVISPIVFAIAYRIKYGLGKSPSKTLKRDIKLYGSDVYYYDEKGTRCVGYDCKDKQGHIYNFRKGFGGGVNTGKSVPRPTGSVRASYGGEALKMLNGVLYAGTKPKSISEIHSALEPFTGENTKAIENAYE